MSLECAFSFFFGGCGAITSLFTQNNNDVYFQNDRLRIDHDRLESVQEELNESKESSERWVMFLVVDYEHAAVHFTRHT